MDALFDKLKAEPANQHGSSLKAKPPNASSQPVPEENEKEEKVVRRESMPPPNTSTVVKSNNKSRSLSPPKLAIKSLKVKVERAKLIDSVLFKGVEEACIVKEVDVDAKASPSNGTNSNLATVKQADKQKAAKLVTPTKAQQKLFDPDVLVKAQQLTKLKVKRCLVRLPRQDLLKLQKKMQSKIQTQNETKEENTLSPNTSASIKNNKRKNNSSGSSAEGSPTKKGKRNQDDLKASTGFFIKINELTKPTNKGIKYIKEKKKLNLAGKTVAGNITTKPTKFTRTQLIKLYGKRFFRAHVKIERCTHPMMLIFESNARARRMQSKRNKSKNLSVSFRDQVEIFGDSSESEPESSQLDDEASTSCATDGQVKPLTNPSTLLAVTPARLKKVENGKVVDDIELDTSLFVVPTTGTSTPFASPGRKRREKKSFSPLKGDGIPSPRKEQLKLANEKMPPSGLRRLPADEVDDEDDEDDECEYIVPIDIPERRSSRTSSFNTTEEIFVSKAAEEDPSAESDKDETVTSHESSVETFASAMEQPLTSDKENSRDESLKQISDQEANNVESLVTTKTNCENYRNDDVAQSPTKEEEDIIPTKDVTDELPKLPRLESISPAQSLNSLNDLVDSLINNVDDDQSIVTSGALVGDNISNAPKTNDRNGCNDDANDKLKNVPELLPENGAKLRDSLNDDISLQLFVGDDPNNVTTNSTFLADDVLQDNDIVDGIVKERIGELTEEKQLCIVSMPEVAQTNDVAK